MTTAITVNNLSKKYVIGHQRQEKYTTLRDTMIHKLRVAGQRLRHPLSPNKEETRFEEFWALKDVNFEVKQGDRIGIIGKNGAGKSTLLKILSRITEPSTGRITIKGRVASLLEVGTGFHPELTGRENIYLNGAVLGMSRLDIKRKFDEIVDFAEVEKFLDTPVKRYSSGMYVRLAFAVAAHLEPEILIVDEVLAVGDAQFQKKCLGKMEDVSNKGRTVLFVSHNMQAIRQLCQRGILLCGGKVEYDGFVDSTVSVYLNSSVETSPNKKIPEELHLVSDLDLKIFQVNIINQQKKMTDKILVNEYFSVNIYFIINDDSKSYRIGMVIHSEDETVISTTVNTHKNQPIYGENGMSYQLSVRIKNILTPGKYSLTINVKSTVNQLVDSIQKVSFLVLPISTDKGPINETGFFSLDAHWTSPREIE